MNFKNAWQHVHVLHLQVTFDNQGIFLLNLTNEFLHRNCFLKNSRTSNLFGCTESSPVKRERDFLNANFSNCTAKLKVQN